MTVVVTGGAGFLGRSVVQRLAALGAQVIPVSRRADAGCVLVADYAESPPGDVLIHLAEGADRQLAEAAGAAHERSLAETWSALLAKGYKRIVYASSAVLYGDAAAAPRRPDDEIHLVDAYTRSKYSGECAVLQTEQGVVARLSNLYGFHMAPGNVVSTILRQIPGPDPLAVKDVTPVRDFLWVDDAAAGLAAMATGSGRGVFNVGTGIGTSVGDLARQALTLAGQGDRSVISLGGRSELSSVVVDITSTVSTWAWRPGVSLRQGLGVLLARKQEQPA